MYITALEHPSYSPDLSPCDFHLFGSLKEAPGGQRFADDGEVAQLTSDTSFILQRQYSKASHTLHIVKK